MPEQEVNSAAAKFISSLVKSLQILCNGQVDFAESIELVGHINVRVDHKYKFDYIVDEQVSKEGEDSSTTFLSNSYHSCPPVKQYSKKFSPNMDQDVMFAELPQNALSTSRQTSDLIESRSQSQEFAEEASLGDVDSNPNYSVTVESSSGGVSQANQMVVKLEGGDDSNDCMVLPASPESHGSQSHGRVRKRRQPIDQGPDDSNDSKIVWSPNTPVSKSHYLQCSTCQQRFSNPQDLVVHKQACPLYTPSPFALPTSSWQPAFVQSLSSSHETMCTMCGEMFSCNRERLTHMNTQHGVSIYSCPVCHEVLGSSRLLHQHQKSKHGNPSGHLTCPQCGKSFTTTLNLRGHMNMHRGVRPYKCLKCGEAFAYSQSKHRHQKLCNRYSLESL